jgi:hypothetical protein
MNPQGTAEPPRSSYPCRGMNRRHNQLTAIISPGAPCWVPSVSDSGSPEDT